MRPLECLLFEEQRQFIENFASVRPNYLWYRIKFEYANTNAEWQNFIRSSFSWSKSPQGFDYWIKIADRNKRVRIFIYIQNKLHLSKILSKLIMKII